MITRRQALALLAGTMAPKQVLAAYLDSDFVRRPELKQALPPVEQRLPKVPRVVKLQGTKTPGRLGGTIRMLIGGQRDIRYMPINGYSRLIGYTPKLDLEPDILESFEVKEERIFTFRLRDGHRWSDGSEFTTEDFRYVWEDMFLNKKLYKGGIPASLKVDGKAPRFEILDRLTIRYSWDDPNPEFFADIASPSPTRLMHPSAYLKQFHPKYQSQEKLTELAARNGVEDWVALHQKMSRTVRPENPELPTLDPWCNRTEPPSGQFIFDRNPYFHRVDEKGQQLPYIDRVVLDVSSPGIIAAKAGTGESDLQVTNLDFADYTFLKNAEQRYPIKVDLWKRTQGSRIALIPNLNCKDPVWRDVLHDVRVRRALSLAIDRTEINKAVFYGLGKESANAVLPESPLFREDYRQAWARMDIAKANMLLDEAGLQDRSWEGIRLLPDGRPMTIIVESSGENSFETDVLELINDHWLEIGVKIFIHISQRDLLRRRVKGGDTIMTVGPGLDNGVPTADMSPKELAPTSDDQMQWPLWGLHALSNGTDGKAPSLAEAIALLDLMRAWRTAPSAAEREKIWHEMLHLFTDQVFTIGIVNATLQPIVTSNRLQNVPHEALYGFDPTSFLGVYMPDTFWLSEGT